MIGDAILSEKIVKVICGFFRSPQNCRGYDLKTPIGKIADCAFRHHNLKDRDILELEKKIEVVNSSLECERQKSARLNRELENVSATAHAENRRLKRALWLARAERADDRARIFYFNDLEIILDIDGYSYDSKKKKGCKKLDAREWRITWLKVERKCRAKAEEYK